MIIDIQPELLCSMQGEKYAESEGYDGKFKFSYLNVPVMFKIKIIEELMFVAGPQVGFLILAKDVYESFGDSGNMIFLPIMGKFYITEQINIHAGPQLDYILEEDTGGIKKFGLDLGAGVGYDINDKFMVELRYSLGLTNRLDDLDIILEEQIIDPFLMDLDIKTKLNFLQIGIGCQF